MGIDEMAVTFDELRQRLKDEREKLVRQLEQNRASAPAVGEAKEGSPYGKKEEGASEAFELEKRLALEKRLMATLAEVEHALRKFDEGMYGTCDSCGRPVEMERLEVLPQANLCLNCMAQHSKNAKGKFPGR
jgi:DnaK suppressor protein